MTSKRGAFAAKKNRACMTGAALCVALAGFAAGSALAHVIARHPEAFSLDDLRLCETAVSHQAVNGAVDERPRYSGWFRELFALIPAGEAALVGVYRAQLLQTEVSDAEARGLADACIAAFERGGTFRNPIADRTGPEAFARYVARREASYATDYPRAAPPPSPAQGTGEEDRAQSSLNQRCGSIVDDSSAQATRSFRTAQSLVERWIRQGAIGAAYGEGELRSGCSAISNGLSRLAMAQCPAAYFKTLTDFRASYYIGFPSGSRYDCG